MAVYPLGFAEGPITATKVVFSRAMNLFLGKGSHCWQVSWTPSHSFTGSRPRWMGSSTAVDIYAHIILFYSVVLLIAHVYHTYCMESPGSSFTKIQKHLVSGHTVYTYMYVHRCTHGVLTCRSCVMLEGCCSKGTDAPDNVLVLVGGINSHITCTTVNCKGNTRDCITIMQSL